MGGFFGVTSKRDAISDVFFGTDYHSHLGPRRGGMAAYDSEIGLQRDIHNIENSPFRTKFDNIFDEMKGNAAIGCISDSDPQPLLIRSKLGTYALSFVGRINNADELIERYLYTDMAHFNAMTGGKVNSVELVSALMNHADNFCDGIRFAQEQIDGSTAWIARRTALTHRKSRADSPRSRRSSALRVFRARVCTTAAAALGDAIM